MRRSRTYVRGSLCLLALAAFAACKGPRDENGEKIDLNEAQPRATDARTEAEQERDSRFDDLRQKRARLSEPRE